MGPEELLDEVPENCHEAAQNMAVHAAATASVGAQPLKRCGFWPAEGGTNRTAIRGHRLSPSA